MTVSNINNSILQASNGNINQITDGGNSYVSPHKISSVYNDHLNEQTDSINILNNETNISTIDSRSIYKYLPDVLNELRQEQEKIYSAEEVNKLRQTLKVLKKENDEQPDNAKKIKILKIEYNLISNSYLTLLGILIPNLNKWNNRNSELIHLFDDLDKKREGIGKKLSEEILKLNIMILNNKQNEHMHNAHLSQRLYNIRNIFAEIQEDQRQQEELKKNSRDEINIEKKDPKSNKKRKTIKELNDEINELKNDMVEKEKVISYQAAILKNHSITINEKNCTINEKDREIEHLRKKNEELEKAAAVQAEGNGKKRKFEEVY